MLAAATQMRRKRNEAALSSRNDNSLFTQHAQLPPYGCKYALYCHKRSHTPRCAARATYAAAAAATAAQHRPRLPLPPAAATSCSNCQPAGTTAAQPVRLPGTAAAHTQHLLRCVLLLMPQLLLHLLTGGDRGDHPSCGCCRWGWGSHPLQAEAAGHRCKQSQQHGSTYMFKKVWCN
jgi:hypothetical protein